MTDIAKCSGEGCPIKEKCYRFTASEDTFQSWIEKPPYNHEKNNCEIYWERE